MTKKHFWTGISTGTLWQALGTYIEIHLITFILFYLGKTLDPDGMAIIAESTFCCDI